MKTYGGDVSDLALTFTVAHDELGAQVEVPLVPGGERVEVTSANRYRYIDLKTRAGRG